MKFFTAIIAIVLILSVQAVQLEFAQTNTVLLEKIKDISSENKWASIVVKMAELHLKASGAIDTLVQAINALQVDLDNKLDSANKEFDKRTLEHEDRVRRLGDYIRTADLNIANAETELNDVYLPQRELLKQTIAQLETDITNKISYKESETSRRASNHQAWIQRTEDHKNAIGACGEALDLLNSLVSGDNSHTALVELSKFKHVLDKIQKNLNGRTGDIEEEFLKVLLQMGSNEYADPTMLQKVIDLITQVRDKLALSLETEAKQEADDQTAFEADMKQTAADIVTLNNKLAQKQSDLQICEDTIVDRKEVIDLNNANKIQFQKELQEENDAYDTATKNFNNLVQEIGNEKSACDRALSIIRGLSLADYVTNRIDQDRVIDTQHGSGISVSGQ